MLELNKKLNLLPGVRPVGLWKKKEIHMRDPFIFSDKKQGLYFLFGTTMEICDGVANVDPYFEVYVSEDLVMFEGPFVAYAPEKGFWGVKHYWAPEIFEYEGSYYMFATFKGGIGEDRGTAILKAKLPQGPYKEHSIGHVTLKGHECLDGTFYLNKENNPYIIFCHEWTELYYGSVKALPLRKDLKITLSQECITIIDTKEDKIPWIRKMEDPRVNKTGYLTDAPFVIKTKERLYMLWSSYSVSGYGGNGKGGYVVAVCESISNTLEGPWIHQEELLLDENVGHSSVFQDLKGEWKLISHGNDTLHGHEYPVIYALEVEEKLRIDKEQKNDV